MELTTPFKLKDLPDSSWSVSWPGYEYVLVNNQNKAQHLLEILFDTVKVSEAQLAVRREGRREDETEILHIDVAAWWQDKMSLSKYLTDFIIEGIKFNTLNEAQKFKEQMDQRLMWRRMGGTWK